jgi:small neutral amino acid transporter SnatA (MarC family)
MSAVSTSLGSHRSPWRRVGGAALLLGLGLVVTFGVVAPPERCPSVTAGELRASATEAVDWFERNQEPDGTWLYLYDSGADKVAPEYNVVRHSGVTMSLYQAASAGIPGAMASADRGLEWAVDNLVRRDGWAAVRDGGIASAGATALLTAGLVERRLDTGDTSHDALLRQLGGFLAAQTERSGAVLAVYDLIDDAPVAGFYSKYYTGETYWALARLHRVFPSGEWGSVADRIGAYLAVDRDRVEDIWPPVPDHWAAYGMAETVGGGGRRLTNDEVAYARRQAGLFGSQVRWVSQRFGPWGLVVRGPSVPRGGGYGVMGEAFTGWWHVAQADDRLADLRGPIAERATCTAALAIQEQSDASEAAESPAPDRVRGAWFRDGETRMDDQQHALSALLRTEAIVESEAASGGGDRDGWPAPSWWLWLAVLVAAINPFRIGPAVPREGRSSSAVVQVAALGAAGGALLAFVLSLTSGPLLDALDVSRPALRIAAGVVAVLAGVVALFRPAPPAEPALPGWRAAIVPVAIPLTASPALILLALSAHADRGAGVVAAAVVVGVAALVALVRFVPLGGTSGRVLAWAARLTGAALIAGSLLLVIDGVLDV